MSATRLRLLLALAILIVGTATFAAAQTAMQFVPVSPCRVVDTRNPSGPFGPPIEAQGERDFALTQGDCSIPGMAAAYSLNVTVVPHGMLGYLTVWPTGQSQPVISTLNSLDGRIKANAAIVPAGTDGSISVYATNLTDVVLDINGYFIPANTSTLAFYPVTPCRVADTRWTQGPLGGPILASKTERVMPVLSSDCNIPDTAEAYSLNFTAVPPNILGYLSVWPTGETRPVVSTLNDLTGTIVANAAIVPAGITGAISVYASDQTNLVIDIDGYFASVNTAAPAGGGPVPLSLYTVAPCRVLDTRQTIHTFSGTIPVSVLQTPCNLSSAQAYVLNATVVPQNGHPLAYLTLWPDAESKPVVSTLNALDGAITSNMAIVPTLNGSIDAYATNPTDLVLDIFSYFAPILPLQMTTTTLPTATLGYGYNVTLSASGGVTPYTWNIPSGSLPPGLTLDGVQGVIAGIPTITGNYPFNLSVVDSETPSQGVSTLVSIDVEATLQTLTILTASLPSGIQNQSYGALLAANGGVTPYTWSITSGSLPPGLTLNTGSGAITGTPTGGGTANFTVQVTDSELPSVHANASLSITITPAVPLSITTTSLPNGTVGTAYSGLLTAAGGVYPYTWAITVGSLPSGLTLNTSTGAITGTPLVAGTNNITVKATDSENPPVSASAGLSITINLLPLSITTTSLPDGIAGQPYSAQLNASGGLSPYSWSVIGGKLPDGLTLNGSTGLVSGTPTLAGPKDMTVQVTDSELPPASASREFTFTINPPGGDGDPGKLSGHCAFYLNGFSPAGEWTLAGSFIADGHGNITSGVVDGNSTNGGPFTANVTGSYAIFTSGLNTLTLHGQSYGPVTYAFVLASSGNGRMIEYDDTTGNGSRGSGALRKADSSAFSLSHLSGGYVFGMAGADRSAQRFVDAGVFKLASGSISNGVCDVNDGGEYSTCTFSGSLAAINTQTGRGVSTVQSSNGTSHQAIYVVSASELIMEQIDVVNQAPLAVGPVLQQSGTFSNSSLNGLAVLYYQDIHHGDGLDQSGAMLLSSNGSGSTNVLATDEDKAGTITQKPPGQLTYTVQSNGAFSFGADAAVGFLIGQNHAFAVGNGTNSILGTLEPQTGGPFSNASLSGNYSGGSLAPLDYANGQNEVDLGAANGAGTLTLSGDSSQPWGLDQWFGTVVNYTIASNGRGTGEAVGDHTPAVFYVISPTKFVVLMPQTDAELAVFEH